MVTVDCALNPADTSFDSKAGVQSVSVPMEVNGNKDGRSPQVGTKLNPLCIDESMKKQSTPVAVLKQQCFPKDFSLVPPHQEGNGGEVMALSPISNGAQPQTMTSSAEAEATESVLTDLMEKSAAINTTVADRRTSRAGRSTQRWLVDTNNAAKVSRLVTGCVPILSGGRILLVSASKKNEWILPKGGWEQDEDMEESAIRETFEEAGVIGLLGPKLSEIKYETRKAKERRLAGENGLRDKSERNQSFSSAGSENTSQQNGHGLETNDAVEAKAGQEAKDASTDQEDVAGDRGDETPRAYSEVCLRLFPLYVQDVMADWPESGRLRKSVDIDEAIELLSSRPEMQSMLKEVKAKGLHIV